MSNRFPWVVSRILNEVKDGDLGTQISSISGAHRKRKWKEEDDEEEEEHLEEEESDDLDTSSEDGSEVTEKNECTDATTSTLENKQTVKEEEHNTEKEGENEKKTLGEERIQIKKPSQPAIFVPVDRSPQIQVCACAWSLYVSDHFTSLQNSSYHHILSNSVGSSTQTARAIRGAGHHGGGPRKSLCCHMWRDGKWKDHASAPVSV